MRKLVVCLLSGCLLATAAPALAHPKHNYLRQGDKGRKVRVLQQRLKAASFHPGPVDGQFGYMTWQAMVAWEKTRRRERNRVVTHWEFNRLADAQPPNSKLKYGFEIDISRQILKVVKDGAVVRTIAISSGNEEYYTSSDGSRRRAHTPRGDFEIFRKEDGWHESYLGSMYYPAYFYGGYAIHGSQSVPTYPASHGCVRVPMHFARYVHAFPYGTRTLVHD